MKILNCVRSVGLSILLAAGLAACDTKPGPAEVAGKKIDQMAEKAGNKIGEAAEKVGQKIDKAADQVGEKVGEQGAKAGVAIDDAEITARVKAAILSEPGLKTMQIHVDTANGIVTLSGTVDSGVNRDRAKAVAGAVAGVKNVENNLVLKSLG